MNAVQETTGEICRRLGLMWIDAFDIESADTSEQHAARIVGEWRTDVRELMEWLDWPAWQTCRPGCQVNVRPFLCSSPSLLGTDGALQEFCYIPTWPFVVAGDRQTGMNPRCVALNDANVVNPGWGGPGGPGGGGRWPGGPGRRPGRGHDYGDA